MRWSMKVSPTPTGGSSIEGHNIQLVVFTRDFKNRFEQLEGVQADKFIEKVVLT